MCLGVREGPIWLMRLFMLDCFEESKKFKEKTDGQNHHMEDKREGQRKAKRHTTCRNQRRERASPSRGRKLSHPQPL